MTLRALSADHDDLYTRWLVLHPHDHTACSTIPCARYTFAEEWRQHVTTNLWEVVTTGKIHDYHRRTIYAGHCEADARALANYEIHQGRTVLLFKAGRPVARGGPDAPAERPRQRVRRRRQTTRGRPA